MASPADRAVPGDRVLPATRALSIVIIPFLLVAFVVLYFRPSAADTARLFAWRIAPPFTPMLLGSVYLGGAYFFARAARATEWHRVSNGFLSVGVFASMMGIATIIHWKKFIHGNVAFWLWAGLYFTTPFLVFGVWALNRRESRGPNQPVGPDEPMLSRPTALLVGAVGVMAALSAAFLFLLPKTAIHIWPWRLTELTARVVGAIFALGIAGISAFTDRRWTNARISLQVEGFMLLLIGIAVIRSRHDFNGSRVLTWVFAVGFSGVVIATVLFYLHMEGPARRQRSRHDGPRLGRSGRSDGRAV